MKFYPRFIWCKFRSVHTRCVCVLRTPNYYFISIFCQLVSSKRLLVFLCTTSMCVERTADNTKRPEPQLPTAFLHHMKRARALKKIGKPLVVSTPRYFSILSLCLSQLICSKPVTNNLDRLGADQNVEPDRGSSHKYTHGKTACLEEGWWAVWCDRVNKYEIFLNSVTLYIITDLVKNNEFNPLWAFLGSV